MRMPLNRILYALILLLAIAYGYDYASVRRRVNAQKPGDPFDVVTYAHLLAIQLKGNKVDYELDAQSPMQSDPCIHSLFPHYGYTPCWYALRRSKNPTQMTIIAPDFVLSSTGFSLWVLAQSSPIGASIKIHRLKSLYGNSVFICSDHNILWWEKGRDAICGHEL